jgi:O-methyltransferase
MPTSPSQVLSRGAGRLKRAANAQLARLGYQVVEVTPRSMVKAGPAGDAPHSTISPHATYSPWLADPEFLANDRAVRQFTLVDAYRRYELWQLVGEAAKLPEGDLLEVGVWRGGTGALIAQRARLSGLRDRVFLCDTFAGVVKSGVNDPWYSDGEHADADVEYARSLLHRLGLEDVEILVGVFPDEVAERLAERRFRFCHLDVDVYESTRDAFEWLWGRLVPGGLVVFDDYGFATCDGVRRFVEEERANEGRVVVHNLNGHAVVVKTSG